MRHYYILALAALSLFSSCQLYEDAPEGIERPGVVLDEASRSLSEVLGSSPHGWHGVMIPGSYQYGGINFCFKFDKKTLVEISSEDGGAVRSTYKLSQSNGIRLTFDTWNDRIGRYASPDYTLLQGLEGDFELRLESISPDGKQIVFTGIYSKNKLVLTRLEEEPEEYLAKVKAVRDALYGKALSPLKLGGKEANISIFGLARQLNVTVDGESKLMPIYFTPEGMTVIEPDEEREDKPSERVGQIGTEILRSLQVTKEGDAYKVLAPDGKQQLDIEETFYDLTQKKIKMYFYDGWASQDFVDVLTSINGTPASEGKDAVPGLISRDRWYQNGTSMGEYAYMGRTDGGDTKVSFQIFTPNSQAWASYYLDFAAVTGDQNQILVKKFVRAGYDWYRHQQAISPIVDHLVAKSPYRFNYWTNSQGSYSVSMTSVKDPNSYMRTSLVYAPSTPLNELVVN
ncbi:DUF4302 domain-containing protein [Porphyromonas sp.]